MDMTNSVLLAAPPARVWDGLNDPQVLKRCIAGCESIERVADNAYKVAMTVAIGPVKAKFKGDLKLEDIDAPNAYTIRFSGQGGVAGFGNGSARVTLQPEGDATRLHYTVDAQVGGKVAQVGSRLIDGASRKMADDFFNAFRREIEMPAVASTPVVATPAVAASTPVVATPAVVASPRSATSTTEHPRSGDAGTMTASDAVDELMAHGSSNGHWTWLAIAVAFAAMTLMMMKS